MKFARLIHQYKYDLSSSWDKCGNIGDCIQNIAVENLYKEFGIDENEIIKINRDDIPNYSGEDVVLLMQGWFGNFYNVFPLNIPNNIKPLYIGFHLNNYQYCREKFLEDKLHEKMKEYQPIGCRDRNTCEFLKQHDVNAYFSGCLTLTYPKRESLKTQNKIFIVDIQDDVENIIPDKIRKYADKSISHQYHYKTLPVSYEETLEFEQRAKKILERYRTEAKLVITSKIHCAMPCIAMGIPIIFINNVIDDARFDVLNGIVPIYSTKSQNIDWNPKPIDIEDLKLTIKRNVFSKLVDYIKKYSIPIEIPNEPYTNTEENLVTITKQYNKGNSIKKTYNILADIIHKLRQFKWYIILQYCCKKNVVLWGASNYLREIFRKYNITNPHIIGIVDKHPYLKGKVLQKYPIYSPEEIKNINPDKIIVTVVNNNKDIILEIENFLKKNSLTNIKVKNLCDR